MFKGKAGSLSYLKKKGFNVPAWMTIQHEDIISWGHSQLFKRLNDSLKNQASIKEAAEAFAESITFPAEIIQSLKSKVSSTYFAVRSSANVEDSSENSFAGIFESKLFVTDLESAIKEVWLSLYSEKALKYAFERKINISEMKMNIVVQEMINGEKSGVLFQADPTGDISQEIIVAGWGLGQGIVDDITDTDQIIIRNAEIFRKDIKPKKTKLIFDKTLIEAPVDDEREEVLTDQDIEQLIQASLLLSQESEHFLDIEFTLKNSRLFILQARPITTLPGRKDTIIFDNSNIAENYPGISTPLTYTGLKRAYSENFKNLVKFLGFPENERLAMENKLENLIGYWGGQIYYNLNNWYAVYTLLPFGVEKATASFNDMVGIKTDSFLEVPKRSFATKLKILAGIAPKFFSYYFFTSSHHQRYKSQFRELYQQYRTKLASEKSVFGLLQILEQLDNEYLRIIKIPLFNDFCSGVLNKSCRHLAIKMAEPEGEQIYNDLLSHREDLESSKAIYSLISLAQNAQEDLELLTFLESVYAKEDSIAQVLLNYPVFGKALKTHFDRFGDRSQWEMKLETPTAREVPSTTLKLIIEYAQSGMNTEEQKRKEREKSSRAFEKMERFKVKTPLNYLLFKILFKKCTEAIGFREDSRFDRVRIKGLSRELSLKLGEALVHKKQLSSAQDIFYLTLEEIKGLQSNGYGGMYLQELTELRKKYLIKNQDIQLHDRLIVNNFDDLSQHTVEYPSDNSSYLKGLPCSGGEVETECIVVKDLNSAPNLTGKILVAERTDPSWGYFFVGVKGIIIEKGSQLSHAAIISRELGIPCIINVSHATKTLKSGSRIRMNGDSGKIEILES